MAKNPKKKSKPQSKAQSGTNTFSFSTSAQSWLLLGVMALFLIILLKPLVIDHLSPQGVDVVGSLGKMHQLNEFHKKTGEQGLWNPNIFAGMPVYHRLSPQAYSLDNLIGLFSRWFSSVFMYLLLGAVGFFVLMRYLNMPPLLAFFGAILFVMMPHYKSLYLEGHMSKLRALMYLPWIFLTFRYFLDKRTVLAAALFALSFGLQIRTQHYQIVFYSGLMVFALGVYPLLKDIFDKEYTRFSKAVGLLLVSLILALAMAAQPLFLAKEYLPYSKRGKTTIEANQQKTSAKNNGVSMKYATQWSTHPAELATWLVPRFYGGMSGETYQGSQYKQLKGRAIPGYWGHMPFTQSYEYMGVLLLLLALLGFVAFRKEKMILSLFLFAVFLILLSFGRHFESFYSLFYHYMPFFNKFRTPMMSVAVTYFIFTILAMYGFKYLAEIRNEDKSWQSYKSILYSLIGLFALGVIFWLYGQSASFVKTGGEPYHGQTLQMIRNIRSEFFMNDLTRYFILILLGGGVLIAYLKKKIPFGVLTLILGILAVADLVQIQSRSHKDYQNIKRIERQYFRQTATDRFLLSDHETFRIFPLGKLFGDNRWAYYHQTIGGYTPIKMYTIEELVEKNIYNGPDAQLPINWNVLKILDVKYVVAQQPLNSPHLQPAFTDKAGRLYTYLFKERLPRAFFVSGFEVIPNEHKRLQTINSAAFNPAKTAILETKPAQPFSAPDSAFAKLKAFSPNRVDFSVYTDKQALLVLSEVYYPPGWKIFMDDTQVKDVYKTDHAIQSIVVPAGAHKVSLRFEPDSYFKDIRIATISSWLLYLVIILSLLQVYREKGRKKSKK